VFLKDNYDKNLFNTSVKEVAFPKEGSKKEWSEYVSTKNFNPKVFGTKLCR
jgi:hypothetical protein